MILTKKEKECMVIQLASQGKTTREIAKAAHVSPLNIGKIIRKFTGDSRKALDNQLRKTLNKLFVKFQNERFQGEAHPTVLWTGNGYHIYQPLDGIVFEQEQIFYDFFLYLDGRDLTTEFMRFAEDYFTNGKADLQHSPSVKSCLIRVPGTFNSKNNEEVIIIQRWNGTGHQYKKLQRSFELLDSKKDRQNTGNRKGTKTKSQIC